MALPEYVQIVGQAAPLPVAWLEGYVLAEYVRFLQEVGEKAQVPGPAGVKWLEGDVLAEFQWFLGEDTSVVHPDHGSSSGSNSDDDDFMDDDDEEEEDDEEMEEEDDEEMEYLLGHIMSLPAIMARVAAAASAQE